MRPFFCCAWLAPCCCLLFLQGFSSVATAQSRSSLPITINFGNNQGLSFSPIKTPMVDSTALAVIAQHLNAVRAGTWTTLQASGTIQLGGTITTSLPATLAINGSDETQLSVQGGNGLKSIVADGYLIKTTFTNGTSTSYPDWIGGTGFLQFHWLRATNLSSRMAALKDAGTVTIQGKQLRKIELLFVPLNASVLNKSAADANVQADFYFDSATFLLDRVAIPIRLPGMANTLLQVTEYSSYQAVSGTLIPFVMKQSIDGQPQWTLSLTEASSPATLPTNLFNF